MHYSIIGVGLGRMGLYMSTYGARTGVTTVKVLVKALCRILQRHSIAINAWIVAHLTTPERERVQNAFSGILAVCDIIQVIPDD